MMPSRKDFVSFSRGSGSSGTATPRNAHSGSQPSRGSQTSRRSLGTVCLTRLVPAVHDRDQALVAVGVAGEHAGIGVPVHGRASGRYSRAKAGRPRCVRRTRGGSPSRHGRFPRLFRACCSATRRRRAPTAAPSPPGRPPSARDRTAQTASRRSTEPGRISAPSQGCPPSRPARAADRGQIGEQVAHVVAGPEAEVFECEHLGRRGRAWKSGTDELHRPRF